MNESSFYHRANTNPHLTEDQGFYLGVGGSLLAQAAKWEANVSTPDNNVTDTSSTTQASIADELLGLSSTPAAAAVEAEAKLDRLFPALAVLKKEDSGAKFVRPST